MVGLVFGLIPFDSGGLASGSIQCVRPMGWIQFDPS
jgi:hypothetical protein